MLVGSVSLYAVTEGCKSHSEHACIHNINIRQHRTRRYDPKESNYSTYGNVMEIRKKQHCIDLAGNRTGTEMVTP